MKQKLTTLFTALCLATITILFLYGCTDNQRAKSWGGTKDVTLEPNHKLINITWKDDEVWVLSEDTLTGISYFKEQSKYGFVQGQVIINPAK